MKIVPFGAEHIEAAAALLEERHRRHREVEPLLPGEVDYHAEIQALWEKVGAAGVFVDDGYLLGTRLDGSWGPNACIELVGHAVQEPELVRDLYADAAARWVEEAPSAAASFAWAREQGYPAMVTDWRVTNLLSSRFWPKRGFRTTFLRLYRSIP